MGICFVYVSVSLCVYFFCLMHGYFDRQYFLLLFYYLWISIKSFVSDFVVFFYFYFVDVSYVCLTRALFSFVYPFQKFCGSISLLIFTYIFVFIFFFCLNILLLDFSNFSFYFFLYTVFFILEFLFVSLDCSYSSMNHRCNRYTNRSVCVHVTCLNLWEFTPNNFLWLYQLAGSTKDSRWWMAMVFVGR